jgi:hypothetical protein
MRKASIVVLSALAMLLPSCSPRDFLTRRLAADLIARSSTFRAPQEFQIRTGIVSNTEYLSPDYRVLQHRGWIAATQAACLPGVAPPPCWDVALTPSGVETFQGLIAPGVAGNDAVKQSLTIPAARRELVAITGIAKQGADADVDFTWRWTPLNEVGAVLYPGNHHYRSTTSFRRYDDGWRVVETTPHPVSLDEALRNAEPVQ